MTTFVSFVQGPAGFAITTTELAREKSSAESHTSATNGLASADAHTETEYIARESREGRGKRKSIALEEGRDNVFPAKTSSSSNKSQPKIKLGAPAPDAGKCTTPDALQCADAFCKTTVRAPTPSALH